MDTPFHDHWSCPGGVPPKAREKFANLYFADDATEYLANASVIAANAPPGFVHGAVASRSPLSALLYAALLRLFHLSFSKHAPVNRADAAVAFAGLWPSSPVSTFAHLLAALVTL